LQAMRFFRDHGVKVLRVMTDNGVSFRSHRYAKALRIWKLPRGSSQRSRPCTHRRNGNYILDLGTNLCHSRFNGDGTNDLRSRYRLNSLKTSLSLSFIALGCPQT
jgi:transposase InsO family protein